MTAKNADVIIARQRIERPWQGDIDAAKTATADTHDACCAQNQQWPDSPADTTKRCLKRQMAKQRAQNGVTRLFIAAKRLF
ncbi:hypothetical protein E4659_15685 [Dickeya dianthicola]|nr:hypothetical protein [Dickeya dianthicola]ATO33888.1 hypothetical protein DDI_2720 [Dickeya dianthicola RNS04.9]MBI0436407.1 hypothetical protein [Dickeya dianthicola]MBI0447409.1 hypothetical protein [Dickeya dianthicola]MBI0451784.1 hypothetical protein [Dickeya dianthicola]MBI0456155.1 hypothetical protein [Dickeya dianthicola]